MICPEHGVEMKKREKDGETWWSHKQADGTYCKGKGKKAGNPTGHKTNREQKLELLKMVAPLCEDLNEARREVDETLTWADE